MACAFGGAPCCGQPHPLPLLAGVLYRGLALPRGPVGRSAGLGGEGWGPLLPHCRACSSPQVRMENVTVLGEDVIVQRRALPQRGQRAAHKSDGESVPNASSCEGCCGAGLPVPSDKENSGSTRPRPWTRCHVTGEDWTRLKLPDTCFSHGHNLTRSMWTYPTKPTPLRTTGPGLYGIII